MYSTKDGWKSNILPYMPESLRKCLYGLSTEHAAEVQEIRLRAFCLPMIKTSRGEIKISEEPLGGDELGAIFSALCEHSVYSRQDEVKNGYLTLKGGHRVGICGRVVMENRDIKLIRDIGSLNIRIAREVKGCAAKVMKYIGGRRVYNTLVISGPGLGKTTLLRDMARLLSETAYEGHYGSIGIIDERSEIAACYMGKPQLDVGTHTDVLDGCPKAAGFSIMLRAMAPNVIVTDEIGRLEDISAIEDALGAGVSVITSAHGKSIEELGRRPVLREIISGRYFQRYIVLGGKAGALLNVLDGDGNSVL